MKRSLFILVAAACTSSSKPPEPKANGPIDRSKDPAFAIHKLGPQLYQGRVAAECPAGARVPKIDPSDWKLENDKLVMDLDAGGCPRWTGYTVVTGHGSPLPFYVCFEPKHDTCEMLGKFTWVFDISSALAANHATSAEFVIPTGVPGDG